MRNIVAVNINTKKVIRGKIYNDIMSEKPLKDKSTPQYDVVGYEVMPYNSKLPVIVMCDEYDVTVEFN